MSDSHQQKHYKSLRRKPPPPLNGPQELPDLVPPYPETSNLNLILPEPQYHQEFTQSAAPVNRQPAELSFDISFQDDLMWSFESPRLKGPQELPFDEYASPTFNSKPTLTEAVDHSMLPSPEKFNDAILRETQPGNHLTPEYSSFSGENRGSSSTSPEVRQSRRSFPQRRFQNLLYSGSSPFFTREEEPSFGSLSQSPPLHQQINNPSKIFSDGPQMKTKGNPPPYPIISDLDISDTDEPMKDDEALPRDTFRTPSRIPSLMDKLNSSQLYKINTGSRGSPDAIFFNTSTDVNKSYPSSPELPGRAFNSSVSTSPSKSPNWSRPITVNSYSTYAGGKMSRSPSPQKNARHSPTSFKNVYPMNDSYLDFYSHEDLVTPRWSLIEPDFADYHYDKDDLPMHDHSFDYSMLPELPKQDNSLAVQSGSLDSTLSFLKNETKLQTVPTIRRKYDDLPPVPLDLPLLPFSSSSLTNLHFSQCGPVWSLSNIYSWCLRLSGWVHGQDISENQLRKALIKLLVFHKRNISVDIIARSVDRIIATFQTSGGLHLETRYEDEELKKKVSYGVFEGNAIISGVLVDLTECYCHDSDHSALSIENRMVKCYSSQCPMNKLIEREQYRLSTKVSDLFLKADWATHWQLTPQEINNNKHDSKKQSFLFDLIKFEQTFILRAELFISLVGPEFLRISELKIGKDSSFSLTEFGEKLIKAAQALVSVHRSVLLEPLLEILIANGKFITDVGGIAKLYYNWSKAVKNSLLEYMSAVPMIEYLLRNAALKDWDSNLRNQQKLKDLQVNGNLLLISTFNSRYQQLPLQLADIRKFYDEQDDEFAEITRSIDAIRSLGNTVNQMKVHADNIHSLDILQKHLTWKTNISQPNINLTSSKRRFYYRGDLSKKGDLKINTNTVHVIVLDNYFLITERTKSQRVTKYKVIEPPISMDFLIVENRDKESGIATKVGTTTSLTKNTDGEDDSLSYPFKVRFAGRKHESHTFFANTESERDTWLAVLEKARFNLMKRVTPLAPYNLQLIDNCYFSYEQMPNKVKKPILPSNDPIMMLAESTDRILKARGIPADIFSHRVPKHMIERRKVQYVEKCIFSGKEFCFVGTNAGVFCTDRTQRWKMILNTTNVTKLTLIPSLNVVLVLGNRVLRHYPLQLLVEIYYEQKEGLTSFPVTNEEVLFYEVGTHKEALTLFIAKKATGETRFKVFMFETDTMGSLTSFSLIKKFYIAGQCHGISVFNTSIAVHTERGFEVMKLGTLLPRTIPELPDAGKKVDGFGRKTANQADVIRRAIAHCAPMGMFKLRNNKEFLLVYRDLAVFVNKAGSLSRTGIVRFEFRAKSIAFADNKLFLVCEEVIEVWSINDSTSGKNALIQVIPSKGHQMVNALKLVFCTTNPKNQGLQMIFQLEEKKLTA